MSPGLQARLDENEVAAPPNRAEGIVSASFQHGGRGTGIARVHEAGGLRVRFPNVIRGFHPDCEAVCINTGGGMVGGDSARYAFTLDPRAAVTITTQSAEKIYRAEGRPTTIDVTLDVGAGATAEWLPQETILYDGVKLRRCLEASVAQSSVVLLAEVLVFGRLAMGETVRSGSLHDRWRIRRDGRLVFAEDLRVDGAVAEILEHPAVGRGARALATVVLVAPDAEDRLEAVRAALADAPAEAGASAWNGLLAVRALSPSPDRLRATILPLLQALRGRVAPRVWQ